MESIRKLICAACLPGLLITPSTGSKNCCPGTSGFPKSTHPQNRTKHSPSCVHDATLWTRSHNACQHVRVRTLTLDPRCRGDEKGKTDLGMAPNRRAHQFGLRNIY